MVSPFVKVNKIYFTPLPQHDIPILVMNSRSFPLGSKAPNELDVVAHIFNPIIWEA